ncbi:MAG: choice-of-anchor Q domain-containing protein, partial [Verrucomicrobiota bacterium]|nr:choice-of-anchor Q domain-containing protein [Verrucomicrobiota bacterium]
LYVRPSPHAIPPALGTTAPLIDRGTPTGAPALDFDGRPRPADGDANGTAIVDLGAFEFTFVFGDPAGTRYFHGPSNAILRGTPIENVEAMFRA